MCHAILEYTSNNLTWALVRNAENNVVTQGIISRVCALDQLLVFNILLHLYIYKLIVSVCMCVSHVHTCSWPHVMKHMWNSEDSFHKNVFSFLHMGPGSRPQAIRWVTNIYMLSYFVLQCNQNTYILIHEVHKPLLQVISSPKEICTQKNDVLRFYNWKPINSQRQMSPGTRTANILSVLTF